MKSRFLLSTAIALSCATGAFGQATQQQLPEPANGKPDLGGKPCFGYLDGYRQCITKEQATTTGNHPYRFWIKSDPGSYHGAGWDKHARDLIFVAVPGGESSEPGTSSRSDEGLIVLDAKNNFAFVRRIPLQGTPVAKAPEEVSGIMASPATNMIYVTTRGHLIALDLTKEKIAWSNTYEPLGSCCERGQVAPDGLTLEVGSNLMNFHRVIDAKTGAIKGRIETPLSNFNHNMGMSADGKTVFDSANGVNMTIADMDTMKAKGVITFDDHVRVFVVNHDASRVYANVNNLPGFEIADVASRKVIKRVEAPGEMWKKKWADPNLVFFGHNSAQHGLALTPDEREIWVPDAINNQILVWDNKGNDNWQIDTAKTIPLKYSCDWITMGLDGKIAMLSSGDIVDVKNHKIIAQMRDERGNLLHSEKFLEITFDADGHMLRTVNQFSEGIPAAVAAAQKEARN